MILEFPASIAHLQDQVLPPRELTFRAFEMFPLNQFSVVICAQDPYPNRGVANGLAFSVHKGQKLPHSLKIIYKELVDDIGCEYPNHGDLTKWAEQKVLLANFALSTLENQPNVHKKHWKDFTESWVKELGQSERPIVWILWGGPAKELKKHIKSHHKIIESNHPSFDHIYKGFKGSKPFTRANAYLRELGYPEIDWTITD